MFLIFQFQESLKPRYEFWMAVNSTNPEVVTTVTDNRQDMTIPIMVETDLVVEGKYNFYYTRSCKPRKHGKIITFDLTLKSRGKL